MPAELARDIEMAWYEAWHSNIPVNRFEPNKIRGVDGLLHRDPHRELIPPGRIVWRNAG